MKRSTTLVIGAVAALGLAAAALPVVAQQFQMPFAGMMRGGAMHGGAMPGGFAMMGANTAAHDAHFAAVDTNGDGTLSAEEIAAGIKAELAKYDTDANGTLSLEEFTAMQTEMHAEMQAEFARTMTVRAFQMHDADGDGQITEVEMTALAGQMGQMGQMGAAPQGGMPSFGHGHPAARGAMGWH
ncbi:MAG: calcium-binding protein [Phaeovulum sp.]|uniref:EF-hand domain-containing protein n=1 Tax=Phaeovulum sp. TaxID=2934796 RepID=UPI0027318B97|nr:calcium-binding protein [Phaeovulum sp.]MDP2061480.1 calcium-binding protein [Phaeovulum sp.]MDP3861235.1 calcium-binding protein [Phaeovulum sp.]